MARDEVRNKKNPIVKGLICPVDRSGLYPTGKGELLIIFQVVD